MQNQLSRRKKQGVVVTVDILIIWLSIWMALSLRYGELYRFPIDQVMMLPLAIIIAVPLFTYLGLYHAVIRYVSFKALWAVFKAVSLFVSVWGGLAVWLDFGIPRSTPVIVWALLLIFIGGSRIVGRWYFAYLRVGENIGREHKKVLIYGAGDAGVQLIRALAYAKNMEPIAFIDDDQSVINTLIEGYRVYSVSLAEELIANYAIDEVLLAIPSVTISRRRKIIQSLERHPVLVRSLPGIDSLAKGAISVNDIQEIDLEDLLGRDTVKPNELLLAQNISDKVVMITGAGGSIGSELCRQIIKQSPQQLILFEQHEYSLYSLDNDLNDADVECVPILGSVINKSHLEYIIEVYGVQTIYHAAAYKHVPMVEWNPSVGVLSNVFGTYRIVQAAIKSNVETFVLISTDKAVRPTNIMGATKRLAELILQAYASEGFNTRFTMVRFGNVIGSSGSVVPRFRKQIEEGGPVTVTHKDITRFFMSISEAVQLVIQAGAMGKGGDVFVLDMGEPVRIDELAQRMIRLSGYTLKTMGKEDGDIEIEYSGLRPGEKLYEELLIGENVERTEHPRIMRANEEALELDALQSGLDRLKVAVEANDSIEIVKQLSCQVRGYVPDKRIYSNID